MLWKKLTSTSVHTGRLRTMYGRTSAGYVFSRPMARIVSKIGTSSVTSGNVDDAMIAARIRSRYRSRSRAIAYAAHAETISVSTVDAVATTRLFSR